MKFNVCIARWPGAINYFEAYREVAESVHCGLTRLGHDSILSDHRVDFDRTNILFGFHVLDPARLDALPAPTVFYNLEQIVNRPLKPIFHSIGDRFVVWDYSERNCAALARLGVSRVVRVPIGYVPELTRIAPAAEQDIDVLFYGMVDERRTRILESIRAAGLRLEVLRGVYGAERDRAIARAKVVLNLHLYETRIFEIVRVSYLLANAKAVVSEYTDATEVETDPADAVFMVRTEKIATACARLVADEKLRREYEHRGHSLMTARDVTAYLQTALCQTFPATSA